MLNKSINNIVSLPPTYIGKNLPTMICMIVIAKESTYPIAELIAT